MAAIDATVAGASANSYITVAAADGFAEDDYGAEAEKWLSPSIEVPQRERLLKRATREIDEYLRASWTRYSATQALAFPRNVDAPASVALVPQDIQWATYAQAAYILKNGHAIDKANARHARQLSQFSEPNTSGSIDESMVSRISQRVIAILVRYPKSGGSLGSVGMSQGAIGQGWYTP